MKITNKEVIKRAVHEGSVAGKTTTEVAKLTGTQTKYARAVLADLVNKGFSDKDGRKLNFNEITVNGCRQRQWYLK